MEQAKLPLILIIDDTAYNRDLLTEMLSDSYRIIQANNGAQGIQVMENRRDELAGILLDLSMAVMNGFEVLEEMNRRNWIQTLPVLIISSENTTEAIRNAYLLGAIDYIFRPFDELVVKKRVENMVTMYANQKKLAKIIIQQMRDNERESSMLISILGHTVEFRNKESNSHINNVSIITKILLEQLSRQSKKYNFSAKDISLISKASALHDIGKIAVPDSILNKPGKLTDEEFNIMMEHSATGAQMINSITEYKDEPLVKIAYKICRWHHERWDGKGYPDGLSGDKIPIEAQVVALADVYDALTSVRCYKKAFTHEEAIKMILNNECGNFNPDLLSCLSRVEANLQSKIKMEINAKKIK